ncbi:ATP-binding cassette domain-containing protein [Actinomadura atramentaria]|uniref:ATP-binding cassette domain-containing protein n=1 Tax=Actinomadura atramentaria TaxID=1990 RepID=UPI000476A7E2|nr:ATP-binding cassette domain-containing protein [Actinomadura atramentaria]
MRGHVIEVRDLEVRAGEDETVRGVSFALAAGEIGALRGPGARAVLEAAAGVRRPAAGTVRVAGGDPYARPDEVRAGAVWRDGGLFPGLTVAEVVDTWRRWTLDPLGRDEALRRTGLAGAAGVPFERLTALQRRLLDLALALVGRSDALFLEEPTAGLGAGDADRVWSVLRFAAEHGVTVLATVRDEAEAARADRSGRLRDGRLVPDARGAGLRAA